MHDACPQAIRDAMELPGLAEERLAAQGLAEEGLAPSSPHWSRLTLMRDPPLALQPPV